MLLTRRAVAEALGTALLVVAVVGSGIAAQRLSPHDTGLELFENAVATGAALVAIILALGPVSGAHLNPVISLVDAALGGLGARVLAVYVAAQAAGAVAGAMVANLMFSQSTVSIATRERSGAGIWLGELVATLGLVVVVFGVARSGRVGAAPFAVGAYITGAYFFTSSTSFANPAVTVARMLSDTFAGISPQSVPAFVGFELAGGLLGLSITWLLWPHLGDAAADVVLPHPDSSSPSRRGSPPR